MIEKLIGMICVTSFALLSAEIMLYMLCDIYNQVNCKKSNRKRNNHNVRNDKKDKYLLNKLV